jgi:hypothetical protein
MKTKSRFLLAASLAFAITLTLSSCGENSPLKKAMEDIKGNLTQLTSSNLLQNGNLGMGFAAGSMPGSALDVGSVDVIESVTVNGQAVEGGSTSITVIATEELEELYISIEGEDGYYVQTLDDFDMVDGKYSYFFVLQFNQSLANTDAAEVGDDGEKELVFKVSGKTKRGEIAEETEEKKVIIKEAESGGVDGLQISVSWDKLDDVDLHVITPSGDRVYYGHKEEGNVKLDFDSNAGCSGDGINSENIYVDAPIEDGEYTVELRLYSKCTTSGTAGSIYHVTANSNGKFIDFAGKKQTGQFNATDHEDVREIGKIIVVNNRVVE